ncbi:uracil-DNA glycosylase [Catenovulum agarivorans DS-2]|uniref:Uracil-DNA glycosylase n=1 Tax=Catenovulum agarivorans DS-2 TaxID=1328313 RepID=W7QW63_9ALTE|nr:uracil-DNA glycosylase family protein [Catenovulum agarivorans]EWH09530.1 uracil-DNA glycosylase [Catenovulum agarivorans DS-2]
MQSNISTAKVYQQVSQCTLCHANLPLEPKPIVQLSAMAKILIIGQAPGLQAHKQRKAFADASGKRLREWLGVTDAQFYQAENFAIMPMAFCYPGKQANGSGDKAPLKTCTPTWHQTIIPTFEHLQLVLLVGQYAQKYYLQQADLGVTENVKCGMSHLVLEEKMPAVELFNLPHPSPRNNIWLHKNTWFEHNCLPQLRSKVAQIIYE